MGIYDLEYYKENDRALGVFGCLCIVLPLIVALAIIIHGLQISQLKSDVKQLKREIETIKCEMTFDLGQNFQLPSVSGDKTVPTQVAEM